VTAAREQVIELGRATLADRDLTPALRLLRELLEGTPYGELIARRRELLAQPPP
jgi:hypothetical protein